MSTKTTTKENSIGRRRRFIGTVNKDLGIDTGENLVVANEARGIIFEIDAETGALGFTLDFDDDSSHVDHLDDVIEGTEWSHQWMVPTMAMFGGSTWE